VLHQSFICLYNLTIHYGLNIDLYYASQQSALFIGHGDAEYCEHVLTFLNVLCSSLESDRTAALPLPLRITKNRVTRCKWPMVAYTQLQFPKTMVTRLRALSPQNTNPRGLPLAWMGSELAHHCEVARSNSYKGSNGFSASIELSVRKYMKSEYTYCGYNKIHM
jgi:hypothetical protein